MRRRFFSNRFDYMILYTSTDGNIVHPHTVVGFNQNIKSNTYNHIGKITFRGPFSIGPNVFYSCETLKTIIIPNSITSIGNYAFLSCGNLTSVTIPDSVTSIGVNAFSRCTSLTSIEIPNSVTSIKSHTFYESNNLSSVYIKATTPPTLGDSAFDYNATNRKIYVPRVSLNAYKTASGWSNYADAIEPYDFDGGSSELTFPITLQLGENGQIGVDLYNYLINKIPVAETIPCPNEQYGIGNIEIRGWGYASIMRVWSAGDGKSILITNDEMANEAFTPSLRIDGSFN